MLKTYILSDPSQCKILSKTSSNSLEEAHQTFISNAYKTDFYTNEEVLYSFAEDPESILDKKIKELYLNKYVWEDGEYKLLSNHRDLIKQLNAIRMKECLVNDSYDSCFITCIEDLIGV